MFLKNQSSSQDFSFQKQVQMSQTTVISAGIFQRVILFRSRNHCVKSVQIRRFFWSVFSLFRLNAEIYRVSFRIQFEYGKIRTRKNFVFGHFSRSGLLETGIEKSPYTLGNMTNHAVFSFFTLVLVNYIFITLHVKANQ